MPASKDLLIAVVSSPNHFGARDAIRKSYALDAISSGRAQVKFFVGQLDNTTLPNVDELEKRINAEPDMVRFDDFIESYHNLSYKALDIFKWASDNGYHNVFKVDDDTYVRVNLALSFLDEHNQNPYMYAGAFVDGGKAMIDNPKSKWYMKDQYPYGRLEDYANGPGLILGKRGIDYLAKNFHTLFRYRVDDAALGIWLKDMPMVKTQIKVDHYSFYTHSDTVWISPVNSQEMEAFHNGAEFTLQICVDTCLCWGDPNPKSPEQCGVTWDSFSNANYQDMVPRMAFM